MRNIDCIIMANGLSAIKVDRMKSRFSFAVSRNKRILEDITKAIEETLKSSEEYD